LSGRIAKISDPDLKKNPDPIESGFAEEEEEERGGSRDGFRINKGPYILPKISPTVEQMSFSPLEVKSTFILQIYYWFRTYVSFPLPFHLQTFSFLVFFHSAVAVVPSELI
jgi:hypothetical protein